MNRWRKQARRLSIACLVALALWFAAVLPLVHAATAPGQRVHSAMRLEFPAGDLLLVVLPTFSGQQGEVALWWAGKHDPMVTPLVRIYGTKAAMPAAQLVSGKESQ